MNWVEQVFVAIALTFCTGTLALVLWKALQQRCRIQNPQVVYLILRLICLLYVLPLGYVLIGITHRNRFLQSAGFWQINFYATTPVKVIMIVLESAWLYMILKPVVRYIKESWKYRDIYGGSVPEDNEEVLAYFLRLKKKLKIRRKVGLYRNDMLASPLIIGIFRCRIILPYSDYTNQQIKVILSHELMHHKSRDVAYKLIGMYIDSIILPKSSKKKEGMMDLLDEWSEYYCDMRSVRSLEGEVTAARYFEMILDVMRNSLSEQKDDYIFSMLYQNKSVLERRIEFMKRYKDVKLMATGTAAAMAFTFLLLNVTTAYAAGSQIASLNDFIYENIHHQDKDALLAEDQSDILPEVNVSGAEDDSYDSVEYANPEAEDVMPALDANEMVSINNWSVGAGVRMVGSAFTVKSGQKIAISCSAIPNTSTYRIGIMRLSNGNSTYVEGKGMFSHTFTAPADGQYRVYVQNQSGSTITASGSYYYY